MCSSITASKFPGSDATEISSQRAGLGVYIHVPFCAQQCTYCDFYTLTDARKQHPLYGDYLQLCIAEAGQWRAALGDVHHLETIYLGGGTPSLMPPGEIQRLLTSLQDLWPSESLLEVTLETQPGTVSREDIAELQRAGINRFSIGAQTFDDVVLAETRRRHTALDTRDTARWVRELPVAAHAPTRLGLDLIYAWPGQKLEQWRSDLLQAIEMQPDHISAYELTFHPDTRLHREWISHRTAPLDDDLVVDMHHLAQQMLTAEGYEHYEISNYARPGARSRHNTAYWTLGDFLGIGVAAHGFLNGRRFENPPDINLWNQRVRAKELPSPVAPSDDPLIDHLALLHMSLRSKEGCSRARFQQLMGWDPIDRFQLQWQNFRTTGLANWNDTQLWLTPGGWLLSDMVVEKLLHVVGDTK